MGGLEESLILKDPPFFQKKKDGASHYSEVHESELQRKRHENLCEKFN